MSTVVAVLSAGIECPTVNADAQLKDCSVDDFSD